jgi:hypothetical protein
LKSATARHHPKIEAKFNEKLLVIQMPKTIWIIAFSGESLHHTDSGILPQNML